MTDSKWTLAELIERFPPKGRRFDNLHDYIATHAARGVKRFMVAQALGINAYRMCALLYPDRYPIRVDDDLAKSIAKLLNRPFSYVRAMYPAKDAKNNRTDRLKVAI